MAIIIYRAAVNADHVGNTNVRIKHRQPAEREGSKERKGRGERRWRWRGRAGEREIGQTSFVMLKGKGPRWTRSVQCSVRLRREDSLTDRDRRRRRRRPVQPRVVLSFRRVNGRWDKARFTAEPTNCGVVPFGYNDAPSGGRPPPTSGDGGTEAKA